MRVRVTIRGLIGLVFFVGFALAALRGASLGWATASILLALLALCTATLGALTGRGTARVAWVGFAVFGWAYFVLHFWAPAQWKSGYGPAHFTTWAIGEVILPRTFPELEEGVLNGGQEEFVILRSGRSGSFFCAACHALASILFGLIGAALGPLVAARRVEERRLDRAREGPAADGG
jgi:hypothetical protein